MGEARSRCCRQGGLGFVYACTHVCVMIKSYMQCSMTQCWHVMVQPRVLFLASLSTLYIHSCCNYHVLTYSCILHTYIYSCSCYTCADLMAKLNRIEQVLKNVACRLKKVRIRSIHM